MAALVKDVEAHLGAYQWERACIARLGVAGRTVGDGLKRADINAKKTLHHPCAYEVARQVFQATIIAAYKQVGRLIVYLDESGFS